MIFIFNVLLILIILLYNILIITNNIDVYFIIILIIIGINNIYINVFIIIKITLNRGDLNLIYI